MQTFFLTFKYLSTYFSDFPDLRLDLRLSDSEEQFCAKRCHVVLDGMHRFIGGGGDAGCEAAEVPRVCLMTSGGGFRAMIAYAGAYEALYRLGIVDCVTYVAALSGSAWFLATLYSHPEFPANPEVGSKISGEIRSCVKKRWQIHLSPPWSSRYLRKIIGKSVAGQPVSFTDFYGYLVGQHLLKGVRLMLSSILCFLP